MTFLDQIWGTQEGNRCVVSGKMSHRFFPSNDVKIPAKTDVWFAPSLLANKERKKDQVVATKALWLDIDCGKPGAYADQIEALFALKAFIDDLGLPQPAIVNSGNGIHVWFVLSEYLTPERWLTLARALREACVEHSLLADHGVTIDIARIMRVPGTKNYKSDPPKPVELMQTVSVCNASEIEDALADYKFKAELKQNAKQSNAVFSVDLPQTPRDADRIADQCRQLRDFRDTRGNIPEPQWYSGLGVLALCIDGEKLAHDWSSGHPHYSPEATTDKYERASIFAPSTCERFKNGSPEGCIGCPFDGKISTPLQLGEVLTPISLPVELPVKADFLTQEIERIQESFGTILPKGYICGQEGVKLNIISDDGETLDFKWIFVNQPVWVSGVAVAEFGGGSEIELSWVNANGRQRKASFKQSSLSVDAKFAEWLLDQNIGGYLNIKLVITYIRASIAKFLDTHGETIVYSHLGMHESGFVIGHDLITERGTESAKISSLISAERVNKTGAKGSIEEWCKATALLNKPEFWIHRFAIIAALASPMFALSEDESSILSLAGESASGKTVAANFGVSAFGHPSAFSISPDATDNSFYERWRMLGNLPLIVNEAATIHSPRTPKRLQKLIYAAANGLARDAMTRDGRSNEKGGWRLLTIFTSNIHMMSFPTSVIGDAERKRILELSLMPENKIGMSIGEALDAVAHRNHGLAGREIISTLVKHRSALTKGVAAKVREIKERVDDTYRYGIWQIAASAVVGEVAQTLNLIDFETDDCIENAILSLQEQGAGDVSPVERVEKCLSDYTNKYQESIGGQFDNGVWDREPRGEARGKIKIADGKEVETCLAASLFREYALEQGVDSNYIKQWVKLGRVQSKSERLAKSANPIWCYVINESRTAVT